MLNKLTFVIACFALMISLARQPATFTAAAQLAGTGITTWASSPDSTCGTGNTYLPGSIGIEADNGHIWTCSGSSWFDESAAAGVPSGFTGMITTGSCPSSYTQVTALNGAMPYGTLAANGDVGGTGGANTITPTVATLTAAAQTFTGSSANTSAVSGGTPAGTNASGGFTEGTLSWPAGVPTFAGNALATHTHTLTPTGTNGTVGWTIVTGGYAASTTHFSPDSFGGVALTSGSTSITVPAETFTGALDTSSAVSAGTPAGTVAWPAGVPTIAAGTFTQPTFTGSLLATHVHTVTATGTNGTSSVTGTLNSIDNRPAYVKVIFCQKT